MGALSILLALLSVTLCVLPFVTYMAIIPAFIGILLGLADINKNDSRGQSKTKGIIGLVINVAAILFIVIWGMFFSIEGIDEDQIFETNNQTTASQQIPNN